MDLDGAELLSEAGQQPVMPTTSTPPPALFEETLPQVGRRRRNRHPRASHISGKLSGTFSAARQGAEAVTADTHVPIEVLDSDTVSGGFGLPAEMVAREARDGADLPTLKAHAESLCARVHVIAVLDTLEFLQRGGRIGRARAMLGTLLNVKPLIEVREGQVLPLENVRTRCKALERMGQIVTALGNSRRWRSSPGLGGGRPDYCRGRGLLARADRAIRAWSGGRHARWPWRGRNRRHYARVDEAKRTV